MKKVLGLIVGEIMWAAACFWAWGQALFYGFPKDAAELKMLVPKEYAVSQFFVRAIPIIWLVVAVIIVVIRKKRKQRDAE